MDRLIYTWCDFNANYINHPILEEFYKESINIGLKNYNEVILYTNNPYKFKDYDFTDIIYLDFLKYDFDYRFDNIPKMISCSLQYEPFIHMDLDCTLYDKIKTKFDIITEYEKPVAYEGITIKPKSWKMISSKPYETILASGIYGGNNTNIYKELLDKSIFYHKRYKNRYVTLKQKITIEEQLLKKLSVENNSTIFDCTKEGIKFKHLAGKRAKEDYIKIKEKEYGFLHK